MSKTESPTLTYFAYGLGITFTLVSAIFNYMLGSWIGTSSILGISVLGCAYASLDFALAYLAYMVRRIPILAGIFIGLWCVYLAALSCWSIMSYSAASDAQLKPAYLEMASLTEEITDDKKLKNTWTTKLGQTKLQTSSWEGKQLTVVKRLEKNKDRLANLRANNPPLPLIVFHQYGLEGSVIWVRSAFGIGFTITGIMLFLTVPTSVPACSKPKSGKGSEQSGSRKKKRKNKTSGGTSKKPTPDMSNVIQLIRNKEVEPNVRSIRGKVGSTDKASKMLKAVGPKLVTEGVLVQNGRGYKYA